MLFAFVSLTAQTNDYYWYKGQKIQLEINYNYLFVASKSNINYNTVFNKFNHQVESEKEGVTNSANESEPKYWKLLKIKNTQLNKLQNASLVAELKKENIDYIGPVVGNQYPRGLTNYFYVKLKQISDTALLNQKAKQTHCQVIRQVRYMPEWYMLTCNKNSNGNTLELSNYFAETTLFEATDPGFMFNFTKSCVTDPLFPQQWGMQNSTNPNIDINACDAWTHTQGSDNIIVAVFDTGMELTHTEYSKSLLPLSYDTQTHTSPAIVYGAHGTQVGGIIGANHNGNQLAGVAPNSKLMSVSHSFNNTANIITEFAEGISWAWQNGASIINNSWGDQAGAANFLHSFLLESAIYNAMNLGRNGLGTVMVFAAGNWEVVDYPANVNSLSDILAVGGINSSGIRSIYSQPGAAVISASAFEPALDVVAPGTGVLTTDLNNSTVFTGGTSFAAPHVAGLAALILSVNHNLTQKQVVTIIETTCQKLSSYLYLPNTARPNGTWNIETGYGLIDAIAAVLMAESLCTSNQLDLFSKDGYTDFGITPNPANAFQFNAENPHMWKSKDIWVRNQPDGNINETHQNPTHSQTNYVYVKVRNIGCVSSFGTEQLDLRWAKAATSLAWPAYWDGSTLINTALAGDIVGVQTIPVIPPGGSAIVEIQWIPPNPNLYTGINTEPWHFCLLSQIISPDDPIPFVTSNIHNYVKINNNIAWKNLTVVDNIPKGGNVCITDLMERLGVAVGVVGGTATTAYDISFSVPREERAKPITNEGKVMIALDNQLYQKWVQGGKKGTGFKEVLSPPMSSQGMSNNNINSNSPVVISSRKMFVITNPSASFNNITLEANEYRTTSMMVVYPTGSVSTKTNFFYEIIQKESLTQTIIGGVEYEVRKPDCSDRLNSAGSDLTIAKGCSAFLNASPVRPCATYVWLNANGSVIATTPNFSVKPNQSTEYTLKSISAEGCISEDKVMVNVLNQPCLKDREIVIISPNPAYGSAKVEYKTNNAGNAYLRLIKTDNAVNKNYPLNTQLNEIILNISDCSPGIYILSLICDGLNADNKMLIVQ
ncbi:MAG: S8 family serine peptidase [Bacteroidetes bacterium]|nr:S8 family serine peptidase [Bacteroidota bacterium]